MRARRAVGLLGGRAKCNSRQISEWLLQNLQQTARRYPPSPVSSPHTHTYILSVSVRLFGQYQCQSRPAINHSEPVGVGENGKGKDKDKAKGCHRMISERNYIFRFCLSCFFFLLFLGVFEQQIGAF